VEKIEEMASWIFIEIKRVGDLDFGIQFAYYPTLEW
jgi:hypothetical protein